MWDEVGPLFERVVTTGTPIWSADQRLLVHRSGYEEEAFFTFSYSPLRSADGSVCGVLDIVTETTSGVVDHRRLSRLSMLSTRLHSVGSDVGAIGRACVEVLGKGCVDVLDAEVHLLHGQSLLLLATTRPRGGGLPLDPAVLHRVARPCLPVVVGTTLVAPLHAGGNATAAGVVVLEPDPRPSVRRRLPGLPRSGRRNGRHGDELGGAAAARGRRAAPDQRGAPAGDAAERRRRARRRGPLPARHGQPGRRRGLVRRDALDADRLALVVGDCVGHGLATATVMGQLRSAGRALLLEDHGPAATLEGLDRFAQSLEGAQCTTVVCAIVDRAGGTLTYSRAGHLPPLVLGADGVRWLDGAAGVPLAVLDAHQRHEVQVPLDGADSLVLFTDGLVERRTESLEAGLQRLADAAISLGPDVPVEVLAEGLLDQLISDGTDDDVALLVHRGAP